MRLIIIIILSPDEFLQEPEQEEVMLAEELEMEQGAEQEESPLEEMDEQRGSVRLM